LTALMDDLRYNPAVTTTGLFGETLHISGPDAVALKNAIAPYRAMSGYTWAEAATTLEDAFIHFTARLPKEG